MSPAPGEGPGGHDADALDDLPLADTPLWLSHHWPSGYDRCAVVAGRHVCRRCLWMYPTAVLAALLAWAGATWPTPWDPWLIWLLPAPAVADFVADNLGWARYSARRQAWLSALGAIAAGKGYVRYLDHQTDGLVWIVVFTYGAICLAAVLLRTARARTR